MFYQWQNDTLLLSIRLQPKASRDEFADILDERLKIRITAPPVDGKANRHLTGFLAKQFGVAKKQVRLLSGETSRNKRLSIRQPTRIPAALTIEPPPAAD